MHKIEKAYISEFNQHRCLMKTIPWKLFLVLCITASCGKVVTYSDYASQHTVDIVNDTDFICKIVWNDLISGNENECLLNAGERYKQVWHSAEANCFSDDERYIIPWTPKVDVSFTGPQPESIYAYQVVQEGEISPIDNFWTRLTHSATEQKTDREKGINYSNDTFYLSDILDLAEKVQ